MSAGGRVLVVGGGASGALMAAHLLRRPQERIHVTIVERRPEIGRGLAYSTPERDHVLNTRAASMSAFPDEPSHFWDWFQASGLACEDGCTDAFCFVSRRHYGRYLDHLLDPYRAGIGDGRLDVVTAECTALRIGESGVAAELSDGSLRIAQAAVLATGHGMAEGAAPARSSSKEDTVLIVGTGLSMIDTVIALLNEGHEGRIVALSRNGLMPQPHRRNKPLAVDAADIPFGTDISYLTRWFRRTIDWAVAQGGDWRDVIDGIRPHTAAVWASMPLGARRRFLRHARTFWEIHRHRVPEESLARIEKARADGRLEIVAGRIATMREGPDGTEITYRLRRESAARSLTARRVVSCTGILRPDATFRSQLLAGLEARGTIRRDPLGLGLDVAPTNAVLNAAGEASRRLFALGPLTAGRFWEVTAVPDIRNQCAALAGTLAEVIHSDRQLDSLKRA